MIAKTSIVCLILSCYMLWFYYSNPHIPTRSSKIFKVLINMNVLCVMLDLIAVGTENNMGFVPIILIKIVDGAYLTSLMVLMYMLFRYFRSFIEIYIRFSRDVRIFHIAPLVFGVIAAVLYPIRFERGDTMVYLSGPKVYVVFIFVIVYNIMLLYYYNKYKIIMNNEKAKAVATALIVTITTIILRILMPEMRMTMVGCSIIILELLLNTENVEKYLDKQTGLFNMYSFETMLTEYNFDNGSPMLAVVCFCETQKGVVKYSWDQDTKITRSIGRAIMNNKMVGYHICENGVAFIVDSEKKAYSMFNVIRNTVFTKFGEENLLLQTELFSGVDTQTEELCVHNVMTFCSEISRQLTYIDYLTHIFNRNSFERDLSVVDRENGGYYFIADLNNLKIVNDTIGHTAGDELIQSFAQILVDAVGDKGKAYRMGGDEFAAFYFGEVYDLLQKLGELRDQSNINRKVKISYAIGYEALSNPDFINIADKKMYDKKKRMKEALKSENALSKVSADKKD